MLRTVVIAGVVMVLAVALSAAAATPAPSFDCRMASGKVEHAICVDPALSRLDVLLSSRYRATLDATPSDQRAIFKIHQVEWLVKRNRTCVASAEIAACLDGFYRQRLDQLHAERAILADTAQHGPAPGEYRGFIGRWRVVKVSDVADGEVGSVVDDDPRFMGLELAATATSLGWLNAADQIDAKNVCFEPGFVPASPKAVLRTGWRAVEVTCRRGRLSSEAVTLTLRTADKFDMEWSDGALLTMVRVADDSPAPPSPKPFATPPLGPNESMTLTRKDKDFFRRLRGAIDHHDSSWLEHLPCGIAVNREPGASYVYSLGELTDAYDRIFTARVKRAIDAQDPDQLFKRDQGVMVGGGEVWFSEVSLAGGPWTYCITAINQAM